MMTLKPKKHKQRFEHRIEVVGDTEAFYQTLYDCVEDYQNEGFELVSAVVENAVYTLFFKRPL